MGRLLAFLTRFRNLLAFIVLEVLALVLLVRMNDSQAQDFERLSASTTAELNALNTRIVSYFRLDEVNQNLAAEMSDLRRENDALRQQLARREAALMELDSLILRRDSAAVGQHFRYMPCRIVENNLLSNYNHLLVNIGSEEGVKSGMGITTAKGVAGIITHASPHFALGMSLLNRNLKLSVRTLGKGFIGSLVWDGSDIRYAELNYVPLHYTPEPGDTVVTSGFSSVFPEGLQVGTIERVRPSEASGFYEIDVRLATDFSTLDYVYVTANDSRAELDTLRTKLLQ